MNRSIGVWGAFVAVHFLLGWICLGMPGTGIGELALGLPLGDVTLVYRPWVLQALGDDGVPGLSEPWVYPIAALLPLFAAMVAGPDNYGVTWLVLVALLSAMALAVLLGRGTSPRRRASAWWWIAFTAALGPIAVARIDAITVPLAIVALLLVAQHPRIGGTLLALATWIKVWPAALIGGLLLASTRRWTVCVAGVVTSVVLAAVAMGAGGGAHLLSFVTEQTGRGLQIEAPVATPYLWLAAAGVESSSIYYSTDILTFQVAGPNVDTVAAIMTPLLALAVTATALIGARAVRLGAPVVRVLPPLLLALVVTLQLFHKVGSPQFLTWLIAPIVLGIVWRGRGYTVPAAIALGLAALTHLVYPYLYFRLLAADPVLVAVLTARNLGYVVLLGWALHAVLTAHRRPAALGSDSSSPSGVTMAPGTEQHTEE
ncbi:glycosyltransferase 87 family protein [Mycetocola zhadangensis]|uniref:glycosyltransferase 87 family protein n=1 Tax=Mycetocola zhadangensis TaxID=1164595 RepID=UPI001600ADF7|nr:glycosyltransferase 87 family protein [Mycetocola zhadangensis]GGF01369.1 membrane protein [Mycetocola zhadangensis]